MKIIAEQNKVFKRIYDGLLMGDEIYLGVDYSTGVARPDLEVYYEQVDEPDIELTDTEALNIIINQDEEE